LIRISKDNPGVAPGMYQTRPGDHDRAVREATTKHEDRDVALAGWPADLAGITHQPLQIAFGVAMQVPVGRIKRHVDMADHSGCLVDLGEKHQAIGAAALDPAHMVVRCPQPGLSLGNHALA
jgi:hypothetical protein